MAVIGTLLATRDGGWEGRVLLGTDLKLKLVPNDNRMNTRAPDYKICCGSVELGALWHHTTAETEPRDYLSGEVDYPGLQQPVSVVVFFDDDGSHARVLWSRRTAPLADRDHGGGAANCD